MNSWCWYVTGVWITFKLGNFTYLKALFLAEFTNLPYKLVHVKVEKTKEGSVAAALPSTVSLKLTKPWTPQIFVECYCVGRRKPIRHGKTKLQTAMVISFWFWGLLACPKLYCDWSLDTINFPSENFQLFTVFLVWQQISQIVSIFSIEKKALYFSVFAKAKVKIQLASILFVNYQ